MMRRLPTTDIYFAHACHDWIGWWWTRRPIRALGPNCFVTGNTMVLIRRDEDKLMRRAIDWPGRLVYLIDDDIAGAAQSLDLPADYRRRLAQFETQFHRRLLERADTILVSSQPLAALFERDMHVTARIRQVFPYWPLDFADESHFAGLERGLPLRIVHLGSASHAGPFGAIVPALTELLEGQVPVHFTYVGREAAPGLPDCHPLIRRVATMRWPTYRRWLAGQRFHLALYPLDHARFDVARSPNKIVEHAVIGAVGLYPHDWPLTQLTGGGCLTAPADPANWGDALKQAVENRESLATLAALARRSVMLHHDRAAQRALWSDELGLA
jgi:hypothetical protein